MNPRALYAVVFGRRMLNNLTASMLQNTPVGMPCLSTLYLKIIKQTFDDTSSPTDVLPLMIQQIILWHSA
ncbi:uncharacterized protein B0I36DRAFT_365180 [Microdochium trichocladiopsis]|uniref:Uncharacterized protein n=1 Tax=Microdochium trichocladiopsis TaxID=1682393 RepID=A0A9P9BNT4_9PEZI|nr:uncharacterized protein B0I36DRAFT_365180 [Microdochium trichocladiopsis]KAH7028061.1 hypothetical protein B0I36DRAFT_365180 [Microdochium trichocladiopsis]